MTSSAEDQRFDDPQRGPAILVVDDEVLVRIVMSEELRQAGYAVFEAHHAHEALSILASFGIALVVADMSMPGALSGGDLVELIRADFPSVKVVIVSGQQPKADILGQVDGFLLKPVLPSELVSCLHTLAPPLADLRAL